jgi:hypothetical protein
VLGNILDKSETKEMQVICAKCFERSDPSFETETESSKKLFQNFPYSLMKLFYLLGT